MGFDSSNATADITWPRRAETALRPQFVDHRLLHRMQLPIGSFQALNRTDRAISHRVSQRRARVRGDAVKQHRAGAAFGPVATKLGTGQPQLVPQGHGQRFVGQHIHAPYFAVDVETDQTLDTTDGGRLFGRTTRHAAEDVPGGTHGGPGGDHPLDELTPRRANPADRPKHAPPSVRGAGVGTSISATSVFSSVIESHLNLLCAACSCLASSYENSLK